jgi:hypothetical protein
MRTTALSILALLLCSGGTGRAAEAETPYTRIAGLASYISAGDTVGALEAFDKSLKNYAGIAENLSALASQTEVLCSIEVVKDDVVVVKDDVVKDDVAEDKEANDAAADVHHLSLDWYMTLKSLTDRGLIERRRQLISVTIQRFHVKSGKNQKDAWRITALAPDQILAPITIK